MEIIKKFIKIIYEFIEAFVISSSIFVVVYLFLMQPHQVKGSSMFPTFKDKEYVMTDKITYRVRQPVYGDVIVFKSPLNETFDFIKRVIATPGQTVSVRDSKVWVDGVLLPEKYLPAEYVTEPGQFLNEGDVFTVPEGNVIAMGDNREHSSDSRDWGLVPYQNITGRVFLRYWPVDMIGIISNPK